MISSGSSRNRASRMSASFLTICAMGAIGAMGAGAGCRSGKVEGTPAAALASGAVGAAPASGASGSPSAARRLTVPLAVIESGRIRTAPVTREAATGVLRFPADVVASAAGAAEAGSLIAGRITAFVVAEGDHVKRGAVLAWIEAPEAARALADVLRARARTEAYERKVARLEGLVAAEAGTRLALDEASLELSLARADLSAARTLAATLGVGEPNKTTATSGPLFARVPIRSPVTGTVVSRMASLGSHVTPETAVFRLVGEGAVAVVVEARVPEIAAARVRPAMTAALVPREGARCSAQVLAILPEVDAATRTRRVRLAPDTSCLGLVAGGQTEVELALQSKDLKSNEETVILVPPGALVESRGASIAFVRGDGPGVFEMRAVEPGGLLGDRRVVRAGLSAGEQVVVEGAILLKGELLRAELGGDE
jgi:membrane fusion protein, heavy metal efflux system